MKSQKAFAGFTLVEVLVAMTLTIVVMTGILTSVIMMGRLSYNVQNYTEMEESSRITLELFGEDVRMASAITWTDANTLRLSYPSPDLTIADVSYAFNPVTQQFTRTQSGVTRILLTNVQTCEMMGYKLSTTAGVPDPAFDRTATTVNWGLASSDTKQLQLNVTFTRDRGTGMHTTQKMISARFILRNKAVT